MDLFNSFVAKDWIEVTPALVQLQPFFGVGRQVVEDRIGRSRWTGRIACRGDGQQRNLCMPHGGQVVHSIISVDQGATTDTGCQLTDEPAREVVGCMQPDATAQRAFKLVGEGLGGGLDPEWGEGLMDSPRGYCPALWKKSGCHDRESCCRSRHVKTDRSADQDPGGNLCASLPSEVPDENLSSE